MERICAMVRPLVRRLATVLVAALGACARTEAPPSLPSPSHSPSPPPSASPSAPSPPVSRSGDPFRAIIETTTAVKSTLDCVLLLCAPRMAHSQKAVPTRAELLAVLDDYLRVLREHRDMFDDTDGPLARKVDPHAQRLRELVATWTPSPDVPADIQLAARAMIDAMGMSPPQGGWDEFEGFDIGQE
jgi:hypothetical protein